MYIAGLQKLTTSDFPNMLAAIVFTQGCNLKCPYCQNSGLIPLCLNDQACPISEEEVLSFLKKRQTLLDGIVITGGEPLLQKDLKEFIQKVKALGYRVKLDTNGINVEVLKSLIESDLLDYVAMDVKNDLENYSKTVGLETVNLENIKQSIQLLNDSKVEHEFRTTIVKEYHQLDNITNILKLIGNQTRYYIQNFEDSENVMNHYLHGFTKDELIKIQKQFEKRFPNLKVRGIS